MRRDFFPAVSVCVAVSAVESVENKFSRLAHRFVSAEEANTAFFWCLGILLTRLAHSLAQKPQENETLLQQTKFFHNFTFPAILAAVLSNRFVVKSLPP